MRINFSNHHFLKNIGIVMVANFLKLVLGLVLIPIYVRYVPPETLGRFDLILSLTPIFSQLISLGLTNSLAKFYLETNNIAYLIYIRQKLLSHTFILLSLVIVFYMVFNGKSFLELKYFILFVILIFLENITFVQYRLYQLHERYKKSSFVGLLADLIRYILLIVFVIYLEDKFLALLLGSIGYWVYMYLHSYNDNGSFFQKSEIRLSPHEIIELKKYSTPLIVLGLSGFLYLSIDRVMVSLLATSIDEVGFLGMAQRLITIVGIVIVSVTTVLGINMFKTKDMEKLKKTQQRYLYFLVTLIIITLLVYLTVSEQIIKYVLTDVYQKSFQIALVLFFSLYWNKSRENLEFYFLIQKNTKIITQIFIVFTILNIVLNLYFITLYDALGAAIATNIAFFLHAVALLVLLRFNNHKITIIPFFVGGIVNLVTMLSFIKF